VQPLTSSRPDAAPVAASPRRLVRPEFLLPITLLIVALYAALNVDIVRTGYGIKGDEATYVSMVLSAAEDGDLVFERKDLQRFWSLYQAEPDGIFLKRGKMLRLKVVGHWPFVRLITWADAPGDKLYYGKAYVYPVIAAPFVRLLGLNGLLVFHVLLLAGVGVCGYLFVAARSPGPAALAFTVAFFGASILPIYAVWLTPEIFNLSVVFFAYFLWPYKEVAPPASHPLGRLLRGRGTDLVAAFLLGLVTFSKPLNLLLIGPPVLLRWWRRKLLRGLLVALAFAPTVGVLFSINAMVSGEFNYQGGYGKTFYGTFPFDNPGATFENRGWGSSTNDADTQNVLEQSTFWPRLGYNTVYFLIGRHAGLVPYYFPAVVVFFLWIYARKQIHVWQVLAFGGGVASTLAVLVLLPYTWGGGGGPPGNRYFLRGPWVRVCALGEGRQRGGAEARDAGSDGRPLPRGAAAADRDSPQPGGRPLTAHAVPCAARGERRAT